MKNFTARSSKTSLSPLFTCFVLTNILFPQKILSSATKNKLITAQVPFPTISSTFSDKDYNYKTEILISLKENLFVLKTQKNLQEKTEPSSEEEPLPQQEKVEAKPDTYSLSSRIHVSLANNKITGQLPCLNSEGKTELMKVEIFFSIPNRRYRTLHCGTQSAWIHIKPGANFRDDPNDVGHNRDLLHEIVVNQFLEYLLPFFPVDHRVQARTFLYNNFPGGL